MSAATAPRMPWVVWERGLSDLHPSARNVLRAVVGFADNATGECFPSQAAIMRRTSQSLSTVQRWLRVLEAAGLIARRKRSRGRGKGRTSDWFTLDPEGIWGGRPRPELAPVIDLDEYRRKAEPSVYKASIRLVANGAPEVSETAPSTPSGPAYNKSERQGSNSPLKPLNSAPAGRERRVLNAREARAAAPGQDRSDSSKWQSAPIPIPSPPPPAADAPRPPSPSPRASDPRPMALAPLEETAKPGTEPGMELIPSVSFADFWAIYPNRIRRREASNVWERALRRVDDPTRIITGALALAAHANANPRYPVPTAVNWLEGDRWEDDPDCLPKDRPRRGERNLQTTMDALREKPGRFGLRDLMEAAASWGEKR